MLCALDIELTPEIIHQPDSVLTTLLAKARVSTVDVSLAQFRIQQSGIATNKTSKAAIAAKADGLDAKHGIWLLADPVHLVLQRDAFSLYPEVPVKLRPEEAIKYQTRLNQHFKADGLVFYIGHSGQWYANAENQSDLAQFDGLAHPCHAIGQSVDAFLPKQAEASQWLQIMNEIQMLLFDCVENQLREQQGLLAVNSVWFHGAGMSEAKQAQVDGLHLLGDSPFFRGLAGSNGSRCEALPLAATFEKNITHYNVNNITLDLTQVAELDQWLSVCQRLLRQRAIKQLQLNLGLPDKILIANIKPSDLWQFWRKAKPMHHYF